MSAPEPQTAPPAEQGAEPLPVVVVGAGGMGRAWIGTVLRSDAVRLVGVVDIVPGAAERAVAETVPPQRREGVVAGTALAQVVEASGARAVVDVTIPAAHHPVTTEALHAGLPVLGEKPCAATLAEALSLAGHAETTGTLFMVSQSRRHNPHLREARRLAEELGGAGVVTTRFSRAPRFGGFREEMAHPLIVDMAIHAFDAGRVLIDADPVSVDAVSANPPWSWYDGDAVATVTIRYASGATHTYTGSWCSPGEETSWNGRWSLSCPRGTVAWDGDTVPSATGEDGQQLPGRAPGAEELWELDASLDAFARAVREGTTPESEVHANIWTQAIVEAAVRSADAGRRVTLDEVLDEALAEAKALDAAGGWSSALTTWENGASGLSRVR
ncbi:oxidoreductase [Brachybacterium phenoliresistens]|uniref:Oxidoreductase n=1 Tax=Brachybacterium phenoliresistens TaxID=396014 RepID=Z9JPW8_9MICO|nr:Gfo/Idh/MocA family oxidoreductase [Brachybacterium phenoliresistens]EWS79807.1 oxidoreductase [Brachybacterium phenoliresistens]